MNIMLLVVVLAQVLVFQILGVRWSRRLPAYLLGAGDDPDGAAEGARAELRSRGRRRRASGMFLLFVALVAGLWGTEAAWGKLLLAAVSLVSAVLFLAGYVRDRTELMALGARLPAPTVRTATLRPMTPADAYGQGWEVLPLLIAGLTLAATAGAFASGSDGRLIWLPAFQIIVAGGGLLLSRSYARSGPELSQRVRESFGDPNIALAVDERLRHLELRAFLGARIGLVLLLAVGQAEVILAARGQRVPAVLEWTEWAVILGFLAGFAVYMLAVTGDITPKGSRRRRETKRSGPS